MLCDYYYHYNYYYSFFVFFNLFSNIILLHLTWFELFNSVNTTHHDVNSYFGCLLYFIWFIYHCFPSILAIWILFYYLECFCFSFFLSSLYFIIFFIVLFAHLRTPCCYYLITGKIRLNEMLELMWVHPFWEICCCWEMKLAWLSC